jgi:integrase
MSRHWHREPTSSDDAPRPKNGRRISGEASKWFSKFHDDNTLSRVLHELRHTWIEAARESPIPKQVYEIITGHAATTESDKYGGVKPQTLLDANAAVCSGFIDPDIAEAIKRLIAS